MDDRWFRLGDHGRYPLNSRRCIVREFQQSPIKFFSSLFLPYSMATVVLVHLVFLFYSIQHEKSVVQSQWPSDLPTSADVRGLPFVSGYVSQFFHIDGYPVDKFNYYMPGTLANLLFIVSSTVATFAVFNCWRKSLLSLKISIRGLVRFTTLVVLGMALSIQLPYLDGSVFPSLGLMRSFGVERHGLIFTLFIAALCLGLVIAEGILMACESGFSISKSLNDRFRG